MTPTLPILKQVPSPNYSSRVAEGPHGAKLAVIEVEMPAWLASDRGLS